MRQRIKDTAAAKAVIERKPKMSNVVKCDACGKSEEIDFSANPPLQNPKFQVSIRIEVANVRHEGHACCDACFPLVVDKLRDRAAKVFSKVG